MSAQAEGALGALWILEVPAEAAPEHRFEDGLLFGEAPGLRGTRVEVEDLSGGVHHLQRLCRDRMDGHPADRSARPLGGLLAAGHRLQQIHRDGVGEVGDGDVGQLPGGLAEVQCGPDAGARPVEQGKPSPGPVAVGDVLDQLGDSEDPAAGVLDPERRHRHHPLAAGVAPGTTGLIGEDQGFARLQHPSQPSLDGLHVRTVKEFADASATHLRRGKLREAGQCPVDPQEGQVGGVDGQADRRAPEQTVQDRPIRLPPEHLLRRGGDEEPLTGRAGTDDSAGAEAQLHPSPAAVQEGQDTGPAPVALARGHCVQDRLTVAGVEQELDRRPAEHLFGRVAEVLLCALAPADDPAMVVQYRRGGVVQRERVLGPLAQPRRWCVHRYHPSTCRAERSAGIPAATTQGDQTPRG